MANRRSFKADISFLEKISMGATGTFLVLDHLKAQGHCPIELERGSTSFKIWKNIKIKRIRVPDILCVDCGKCVECRTKKKPEISMSHSKSDPERGWDYGLDDNDFVAFVACEKGSDEPIDWRPCGPVQYVSVEDMRTSEKRGETVLSRPKGAEEAFEMRIIWPTAIASAAGVIASVSPSRIQFRREKDRRLITLRLSKQGKTMAPMARKGDRIVENQIVACVLPVRATFSCDKGAAEEKYLQLLSSASVAKRYTAVKALGFFTSLQVTNSLVGRLNDRGEHVYVRLEAAAGLARQGDTRGYSFMEKCLTDEYLQKRLEAVIVLGEIKSDVSCRVLMNALLDRDQHPEIRAGAAWALGELRNRLGLSALTQSFAAVENGIRVEAARALAKLAERFTPEVLHEFSKAEPSLMPGISWALGKRGRFSIQDMLRLLGNNDARRWVAYVIGTQHKERHVYEIERLREKDPEVYFAVTVLWNIMSSWVWGLEEY